VSWPGKAVADVRLLRLGIRVRTAVGYSGAVVVYVAIGSLLTDFLLSVLRGGCLPAGCRVARARGARAAVVS